MRTKRSISLPEELSEQVDAAAEARDLTPSAWLADAARRQLFIESGIAEMDQWFAENGGPPTDEEKTDAKAFVDRVLNG